MAYFSRLTEIVSCNLQTLIEGAEDRLAAIREIVREMEDGVTGARRSCQTATHNEARLVSELESHQVNVAFWTAKAKEALSAGREDQARQALLRKREVEDLMAGLKQQQTAAASMCAHLQTTLRALEARLAEARRRLQDLESPTTLEDTSLLDSTSKPAPGSASSNELEHDAHRASQIEAELDALRKELGG